jgi:hypothetical protein
MLLEKIIESFGTVIAACIGIVCYRKMNVFYRILFIQLISWLILYVLSYVVTGYQKNRNLPENNQWVFNIQILCETTLLLFAANSYFEKQFAKRLIMLCWILFLFFFAGQIAYNGFYDLSVTSLTLESILMIIIYTLILFRCFYETFAVEIRSPEVWASIGLILYFGCNLPYFSLFNYLNNHYLNMSETLHRYITDGFSNIRYILLAIGFLVVNKNFVSVTGNP